MAHEASKLTKLEPRLSALLASLSPSMPSYHSWGPNGQHSRLPPTPPEYQNDYITPISGVSEHSFYPSQGYGCRRSLSSREYNDRYQAPSTYNQQPLTVQAGRHGHGHASRDYPYTQSFGQPGAQFGYTAAGAPVLPPIRINESLDSYSTHYAPQHVESKPKEDKPTGGVAQHLDYDMDLMANFVADMSQKL
jgi:hypothetical protein